MISNTIKITETTTNDFLNGNVDILGATKYYV